MARRGFFSRITNAIRSIFSREHEKPSAGPDYFPPGPEEVYRSFQQRMRDEWNRQHPNRKFSFRKNYEFLVDLDNGYNIFDEDEIFIDWRDYIRYMVKGDSPYLRRDPRNPFWPRIGIDPIDFPWDDWRAAMGYKARQR
jgi:hypothetical protein